jgi:hypothetical protein
MIYSVNKNKMRMKQNSEGEGLRFAKKAVKQARQPQTDTRQIE